MAIIKLNKGYEALVDDELFEELNQYKWSCVRGYVLRHGLVDGAYKTIYMHRVVNNTPKGEETDHVNQNKQDNRKENLRTVSRSQNNINKKVQSNNTSGFRGVSWVKNDKTWRAGIKVDNKTICLGRFKDKKKAAQAYNLAAVKHFEQYAKLNEVTYELSEVMGGGY